MRDDELPEFMAFDARKRQEIIDLAQETLEDVHPRNRAALGVLIRTAEKLHADCSKVDAELDGFKRSVSR